MIGQIFDTASEELYTSLPQTTILPENAAVSRQIIGTENALNKDVQADPSALFHSQMRRLNRLTCRANHFFEPGGVMKYLSPANI